MKVEVGGSEKQSLVRFPAEKYGWTSRSLKRIPRSHQNGTRKGELMAKSLRTAPSREETASV